MNNYFDKKVMYRFVEKEEPLLEKFKKNKEDEMLLNRLAMLNKYKNRESFTVDRNYIGYGLYLANQYPNIARKIYQRVTKFEKELEDDLDQVYTFSFLTDEEIEDYKKDIVEGEFIDFIDLLTRESIYEVYRRLHNPNLNSRYNSLFLTDKDNIDYWKSILEDHDLYELEVSGNYYKTCDNFLSPEFVPPYFVHEYAKEYWNIEIFGEDGIEYLFNGNVKVLRKI